MDALPQQPYFQDIDVFVGDTKDGSINIGGAYDSNTGEPLSSRHVEGQQRGEQAGQNGVTIDLPRLETTSESTVVGVPDGGTVLIGGIKREASELAEGKRMQLAMQQRSGGGQPQQGQGQGQQQQGQGQGQGLGFGGGGGGMGGGGLGGGGGGRINSPIRGRKAGADRYSSIRGYFEADLDEVYDESKSNQRFRFESKSREQYAPIYENAFVKAAGGAAVSTFSIDVDTASYANMRRFLNSGQMPPRDSVRIEELVNYFQYNYPQPKGDDPFSVNMELATCPWNDTHKLLRVGLKGKEIHVQERPATNVV